MMLWFCVVFSAVYPVWSSARPGRLKSCWHCPLIPSSPALALAGWQDGGSLINPVLGGLYARRGWSFKSGRKPIKILNVPAAKGRGSCAHTKLPALGWSSPEAGGEEGAHGGMVTILWAYGKIAVVLPLLPCSTSGNSFLFSLLDGGHGCQRCFICV